MIKNEDIVFISDDHKKFYEESLQKCRYDDEYHKALCYCLGISADTRNHIEDIYDFKSGLVNPECITHGWQTSGTLKVVRLAFNLYCNGTPTEGLYEGKDFDTQLMEIKKYTVEDLFCCCYTPFFWQAIKLRYPEYANYNTELYKALGSRD